MSEHSLSVARFKLTAFQVFLETVFRLLEQLKLSICNLELVMISVHCSSCLSHRALY